MAANLNPKVLLIEDNEDLAQLLGMLLTVQGCSTEVVHDARSGLEKAKNQPFDIIFSDINLPGTLNGLQLAQVVRKDERLAHLPLVAISGHSNVVEKQRALDAGYDLVFPKPVRFAELSMAIKRFSRGRGLP